MLDKSVEHQGMADEEFILKFFDDGFSCFGPTAPVNMAKRISVAIVTQRNEFLALSYMGSKSHPTVLVFESSGKSDSRQWIPFGKNQRALGKRQPGKSVE